MNNLRKLIEKIDDLHILLSGNKRINIDSIKSDIPHIINKYLHIIESTNELPNISIGSSSIINKYSKNKCENI